MLLTFTIVQHIEQCNDIVQTRPMTWIHFKTLEIPKYSPQLKSIEYMKEQEHRDQLTWDILEVYVHYAHVSKE